MISQNVYKIHKQSKEIKELKEQIYRKNAEIKSLEVRSLETSHISKQLSKLLMKLSKLLK